MPNWCNTTYKCVGDPKEVKELFSIVENIFHRKQPIQPNGFGPLWLGELVNDLGYNWKEHSCRGEMTDYSYDGEGCLTINQCTAWCEQPGVRYVIEDKFPSINVYYMDEEPGCEVYRTNDSEGSWFSEKYLLEGDDCHEYFETIEQASEYINEYYGLNTTNDLFDIQNKLDEYIERQDNYDLYLYLHEFTISED